MSYAHKKSKQFSVMRAVLFRIALPAILTLFFCLAFIISPAPERSALDRPAFAAQKAPAPLLPSFDLQALHDTAANTDDGEQKKPLYCRPPPEPIRDLLFQSIYADHSENASIVDPVAKKQYKDAVRPLSFYANRVSDFSDTVLRPGQPQANREKTQLCALRWLAHWAEHDALLGRVNPMGQAVRKWALASLSGAYIKIRSQPLHFQSQKSQKKSPETSQQEKIEDWLHRVAAQVILDYSAHPDSKSRRNNHIYWAGWAVMSAGIALDDRSFYGWGVQIYRHAMRQIDRDGSLPLELERKGKAYNYHVFAAGPLVMMAETGIRNGLDLYSENDGALHRLIALIVSELDNGQAHITKRTGHKQDLTGTIHPRQFAWMEPYYARFPDKRAAHKAAVWIEKFRPMQSRRLGGDLSLLFGHSTAAAAAPGEEKR